MYNKQKAKAKELTTLVIPGGTNLLSNVNNTFLPSLADKIHTHKVETHKNKRGSLYWPEYERSKASGKQKWIKTLVLVRVMGEVPQAAVSQYLIDFEMFWFLASNYIKGLKYNTMCIPWS